MADPLAFIFDMDGVIIDSTAAHVEAWKAYLLEHGIEIEGLELRMLGKHNGEIVRDFFTGIEMTDEEIFAHGAQKEALFRTRVEPDFKRLVVPGVVEFVRRHQHVPMAVASNAEPANIEFVLERAGLQDCFRAIVTGHDVERPKPFPDIYLKAAELLGTRPSRCVVFEDSITGVTAARAAQMKVVGVLTTLEQFDNVDLAIPNFTEHSIEDWLADLFTRSNGTRPDRP